MISELARKFENIMTAVTFAERGLHKDAKLFLNDSGAEKSRKQKSKRASVNIESRPQMRL